MKAADIRYEKNLTAFYDAQHELAAQKWMAATAKPVVEGNIGAQIPQARASYDGDRFDRLAQCESGGDPTANTGNGFFGAFQFMLSSWRSAGGSGYPHEHSYAEQKAIAMHWASITNPATQWPVCWPRSA